MAKHVVLASLALVASVLAATPASAVGETCDGRPATHVGTAGNDTIHGTNGDDVMVGLEGNDILYGFGGSDIICGDAGADDLFGYDGNDRLFGGLDGAAEGDHVAPGTGADYVDAGLDHGRVEHPDIRLDTVSYRELVPIRSTVGIHVDLTPVGGVGLVVEPAGTTDQIVVSGMLAVVGTLVGDTLVGSPFADVLVGYGGADDINGKSGDDSLYADGSAKDGPDTLDGGPGNDWIMTDEAGGIAMGGDGQDVISAFGSNNVVIDAGSGADRIGFSLFQSAGAVDVSGGGGRDIGRIKPEQADFQRGATITLDQGQGLVRTDRGIGAVRDLEELVVNGGDLHWRYRGTDSADRVLMRGGLSLHARTLGGPDYVTGTRGHDVFDLGRGRDYAEGGHGRDTCIGVEGARSCEIRR